MTPVRFLEEAQQDLLEQVAFYEDRQRGLGDRFRESVRASLTVAATNPRSGSPWKRRTRRVFTKGFPFSLVYRVEAMEVVVLAVAHFKRRPTFWRCRGDA